MPVKRRIRRLIQWVKGDPDESGEPDPVVPGSCCLILILLVAGGLVLFGYMIVTAK